jgi:hypothetical protein
MFEIYVGQLCLYFEDWYLQDIEALAKKIDFLKRYEILFKLVRVLETLILI